MMPTLRSPLAVLLFAAAATVVLHAEDFSRTLPTSGTPHVSVNTGSGYIHLVPGSANEVRITGHVRKDNSWHFGGNDDDRIRRIVSNPPIEQTAEGIVIGRSNDRDLYQHINIDYDVTLPANGSIEARSGSGDVRARGFNGPLAAHTGSGDVEAGEIGSNVRLDTGSGSIRASNIRGAAIVRTGSGDIELRQTAPGDVRAETGSGSIRLQGVNGGLRATTGSGEIDIQGQIATDWHVDTGSGSIRIALGRDAHFGVEASTGSGTVHTEQQIMMRGSLNPHRVTGSVNGGGPILHLQTGSGDIQIR